MAKKNIPTVESIWQECSPAELRKKVMEYFQAHLKGVKVVNHDTGIPIEITMKAGRKTAMGEAMYGKKAEIVRVLPQLLETAKYNNFGNRKEKDNSDILGYLNFKGLVILDGKKEHLRIAVKFLKGGYFYYNIEVNKPK